MLAQNVADSPGTTPLGTCQKEGNTTNETARSSQNPLANHSGVDYHPVARAKLVARKHLQITTTTDALVAAFRRLSRSGWLSQRIDARTCYTMRPSRYTPAEHAIIVAEIDWRKGTLDESAAEHASVPMSGA